MRLCWLLQCATLSGVDGDRYQQFYCSLIVISSHKCEPHKGKLPNTFSWRVSCQRYYYCILAYIRRTNWLGYSNNLHCVSIKLHPFIVVIFLSDFIQFCWFLAQTCPRKFETKRVHGPKHISFCVFVLCRVKTSDASEGTVRRWPLTVRLVIEPESCSFFKSLFKPLAFHIYQKILKLTFYFQQL